MMRDANLDDLAAFAAVAATLNFTRAARALGTSTSNLSHTIRRLETRLDARLLQRTSRSVALTEAGETLLATLRPALDSITAALGELEQSRDRVAGALRLTCTRQAYEAVLRPILPTFVADHPDASVEVLIDYAYRDIVADGFDAGIRLGEKIERDMIALKVGPALKMAVVASPGYHKCINYRMTGSGALYAWEFERGEERLTVQVSGPLAFNEPELMLQATLDDIGVGYLLDHEVSDHIENGRLVRLLGDWTPPFPGFHIYYSSRRQMRPVMKAFTEALRRQHSVRA
jgi:DNA-binding transcriptional LysR family regulator